MTLEPLELAYRSYQLPAAEAKSTRPRRQPKDASTFPSAVLVLDTETTIDETQRLNFLSYRFLQRISGCIEYPCAEEGLVYAADLPVRDPAGFHVLEHYAKEHVPEVSRADVPTLMRFRSQHDFLYRVFYRLAVKAGAAVVGFNLPFDLSRFALRVTQGRGQHRRALNLVFWENPRAVARKRASMFRPGVSIRSIDSKRGLISFTDPLHADETASSRKGLFVDLKTLAFALTDESLTLAGACERFNCEYTKSRVERHGIITLEYIDYNRQDVRATVALFEACVRELARLPLRIT